jgi:DNA-binding MarR family transcriptional regulator
LSRSRITRICDALEARGLLERVRRSDDSRGVDARLTAAGAALVPDAQATHLRYVEERFFAQLSAAERAMLAEVFGRLAPGAAPACAAHAEVRASESGSA